MKKNRFKNSIKNVKTAMTIAAISAAFAGCKKQEAPKQAIPPSPVVLSAVESIDTYRFIDSVGTTASLKGANIVPQVSGQIVSINFNQGEFVKEGDIIAVIDKRPFEAQVLAAHAQLLQAQAKLKIDTLAVERNKNLAEKNYVDKQTFDALVATVDASKGAVEAAQASLDLAKINLEWCTIKAPISGKVGLYSIDMGNVVSAGISAITTIEQTDKLFVDFIIPTHRMFDVRKLMSARGGKLEVEVSYIEKGYTDRERKATVSIIENKAIYSASTVVMRGELDNKDGLFSAPQSVKARLLTDQVKGGIFIHNAAIQTDAIGPYVFVAEKFNDTLFKIKKVHVTLSQLFPNGKYLIETPKDSAGTPFVFKGNEKVVSVGQLRIGEGALAYAAIPQGAPIGADGKPITNPQEIKQFIQEATKAKIAYEAEIAAARAQASQPKLAE